MNPGTVLERWEIVRRLGEGGQAEVFEARHVELGLRAALKVLGPSSSADRLITEGRVLARLQHRNLGRVLDVLRLDARPVLVLEYVEGPTLRAWLAERRRPWDELAPILAGVLDGVEAAHAVGVVHRDLKPANVLLAPGLVPKVVDFGIAYDPGIEGGTRSGAPMGTPRYMAPEQLRHAAGVDARADVWALGALLYEATTGRPPFEDDDLIGLHAAFLARAYVEPRSLAPDLPNAVTAAIEGALDPVRERRIPDVATLRAVLAGAPWAAPATDTTWEAVPADTKPAVPGVVLDARAIEGPLERWTAHTPGGAPASVRIGGGEVGDRLGREAEVLRSLPGSLRVVRAIGAGTLADGRAWLATLDAPGVPLPSWSATRRSRDEIHSVIAGALETAATLHALSPPVWVRDWTPARLAIAPDGPWLVELGLVRATPTDPLLGGVTFEGDFGYLAPEQMLGESDSRTDVWGIGALAVALFTRKDPRVLRRGAALDYAGHAELPAEWRAVLDAMLATEPADRPDAATALSRWRAVMRPAAAEVRPPGRESAPRAANPGPAGPLPFKEAEPVPPKSVEDFNRPLAAPAAAKPSPSPVRLALGGCAALSAALVVLGALLLGRLGSVPSDAPAATAPERVAPPVSDVPPAAAPDDGLRREWSSDGTLIVTRGRVQASFEGVPIGEKRKPAIFTNPSGVNVETDQECHATILLDEKGHAIAVKVAGCDATPAEMTATTLIDWQYAPTGALTAQSQKLVFKTSIRRPIDPVAPSTALDGFDVRPGDRRHLWARPEFTSFDDYPTGGRPAVLASYRPASEASEAVSTWRTAVDADGRVVAVEVFGSDATPATRDRAAAEAATRYAPGSPRSFERKIHRSAQQAR